MLYCFGDSWGYGSELDFQFEKPFINLLSEKFNIPFKNLSVQGNSFPNITRSILINTEITKNDFAIVVVPPDIRWYFEHENAWHSLWIANDKDIETWDPYIQPYFKFYKQTATFQRQWYSYHFTIFLIALQNYFYQKNINFLLMHNYGIINYEKKLDFLIHKENFLDFNKSLTTLLGGKDIDYIENNLDGDNGSAFIGKYFEGNGSHPNQSGHQEICNLIIKNKKFENYIKNFYDTK